MVFHTRVRRRQLVLQRRIEARDLLEKRVVVIRQAVHHLVDDLETVATQNAGLPQRQDRAPEFLLAVVHLRGGEVLSVALGQDLRHFHLAIDGALATNFCRVRRQNRRYERGGEESRRSRLLEARLPGRLEGVGDRSGTCDPMCAIACARERRT